MMAMTYDEARGVVLLHGGRSASRTALGDLWAWNGSVWTRLH